MQELEKELKVSATLQVEQQYELTSTPELMYLAAYVAEDGLVGHYQEEKPLGITNFICPSRGEHQGQELGMGGQGSRGEHIGDF